MRQHSAVDPARVVVSGASQGGGLALATAGFVEGLAGLLCDVPFLCDFARATSLSDTAPYSEVGGYLKIHPDRVERVFATLAYFDCAVLGRAATAPALFSVGMMDPVCPPSTVFAAFNNYGGAADIEVYAYSGHEGGGPFQERRQLAWLRDLWV